MKTYRQLHTTIQNLFRLVLSSAMLAIAACAGDKDLPTSLDPSSRLDRVESGTRGPTLNSPIRNFAVAASSRERTAGEYVARTLALALRNPAVGQEIKQALASSAVKEHKLHLSSFLQGRGGRILAGGYRAAATNEHEFQAAMNELRQLEFYMPVEAHREAWQGTPEVLVAIAISKGDRPVAFTTEGSRLELEVKSPPVTPTLVITNIESDFRNQIGMNERGLSAFDCQSNESESLGASARRCEKSINRTPGSGVSSLISQNGAGLAANRTFIPTLSSDFSSDVSNVGLYANFLRIMDVKEYWFQGTPEVEIHVTGKRNGPTGHPIDYQCAGEHANDANGNQPGIRDFSYVFEVSGNFWNGDVRILNAAQVDSLAAAEPAGFNVSIWEDDGEGPCNMHENHAGSWANAVAAAAAIARGVNAVRPQAGGVQWGIVGGVINELATLIQGGDEQIGTLVIKDSTTYAGQFPGNTHVIFDGNSFNGRATLYMKRSDRTATIQGPSAVGSMQTATWTGNAGPASGVVSYAWNLNGELVQEGTDSQFTYTNTGTDFSLSMVATDDQGVVGGSGVQVGVTTCEDPTQDQCDGSGGGGNRITPATRPSASAPSIVLKPILKNPKR